MSSLDAYFYSTGNPPFVAGTEPPARLDRSPSTRAKIENRDVAAQRAHLPALRSQVGIPGWLAYRRQCRALAAADVRGRTSGRQHPAYSSLYNGMLISIQK